MLTKPISSSSWAHSLSAVICGHETALASGIWAEGLCGTFRPGWWDPCVISRALSCLCLLAACQLSSGEWLYPVEPSMMKKCPNSLLSNMVAMCSLSIWNVACVTEELNFILFYLLLINLNSHRGLWLPYWIAQHWIDGRSLAPEWLAGWEQNSSLSALAVKVYEK